MHLLFRTYVHSRRATAVSVIGMIAAILLGVGACGNLVISVHLSVWPAFVAALICIALSILCYRGSRSAADAIAIRDLEKKLGKPIFGEH